MKIHFASLFGVDYDMDLLPFWAKHYMDMKLDSYHLFLHRESGEIGEHLKAEFRNCGFSFETIGGPQGNGVLRKLVLANYASRLPKDDLLVTADADEFQELSVPYHDLHADMVFGFLTDHYTGRLEACYMDPFIQYPEQEPFTGEYFKNFTPPFLQKTGWPLTRRTKVLAARAGAEVAYAGSHCVTTMSSSARIAGDRHVHHFAWRESAKAKLLVKHYYSIANLHEIFDGENIDEDRIFELQFHPDAEARGNGSLQRIPV